MTNRHSREACHRNAAHKMAKANSDAAPYTSVSTATAHVLPQKAHVRPAHTPATARASARSDAAPQRSIRRTHRHRRAAAAAHDMAETALQAAAVYENGARIVARRKTSQ